MSAYDDAIEKLAETLAAWTFNPDRESEPTPFTELPERVKQEWRIEARKVLAECGLVALEPALIGRLRETRVACGGSVAGTMYDGGVSTPYGDACVDLADAVLTQLKS